MKKEREFLTELYSNHIEEIPFLLHFQRDKQLKSKLFVEYLQTETKPNFSLYLSSHFSKTELDNGFAEIQNNIPVSENKNTIAGFVPNTDFENKIYDLRNQFYDLVAKRELPEIYYSHSIVETKVVEKLKLVKQEIKDFEQFVFDATFYNPNDYATNFAKNIIKKLESTALPKLKNEILTNFINKQININLEIEFLFNEIAPRMLSEKAKISKEDAGRKYRELKMYADVYINEYLESNSKKENELLAKYKSIGFLDFKKVNTALSKIDTITEKLEYLKEIKEQYYDKYENLKTSLDEADYIYYVNNSETFWQVVFGNYSLYSPLSIQKPVYNKFFSNGLKTPEFTYWFLKYDAENVFNHTINSKIFKDKLNSDLKETFIKSELKQLEEQEQKAKDLLLNKELDIYNKHKNNYTYEKEVVLLRILDGNYYKENCSFKLGGWGTLEVQAYYKHILLKPYLEMQLKKTKSISTMEVIMSNKQNEIENNLTTFERINRELNIIAWAFECQSMEATTTMSYPMLHSKGRFLFNFYKITSNIEMLKLQDYIKHYTERFETTNNTSLVLNELKKIHEKARSILDYHNENLTESSKLAIDFYENIPTDFEESIKYKKEHTATIVTENLNPYHIVFEEEFHFDKQPKYNYLSSNNELSLFCQKLIDFTEKFEIIETVSIKSDPRINLVDLSNHRLKNEVCHEFDRLLIHFQENKYLIVNKDYKIYSAGISYLFSTKNINAKNLETKEDFILDSKPYFDTFINAFKDGEKYFKDKFEVSKEVLYGNNSKTIVADIHQNYFHIAHSDSFTGWVGVIHSNPMLITHEIIKKYGFYSGILSKADAFISEYPNVFIDFHKCSNESTKDENQNVSLESILKKQNNLLPKVSIQDVYNHFNILTTSTNKNNQFYLTNEQLLTFILSTFVEQKPIKQNFNCDGIIKKEVRKVFYDFYFKNKNKETNQTKLKRKYFNIMNNAFNGFNENDYTDFAK